MLFSHKDKIRLKNHLFKIIKDIDGVISVTLVGSFWNKTNLDNFSDVDIVIILKKLNKKNFNSCIKTISKINLKKFNLGHLKLLINPTFGPLKFDDKNSIVFHTMIYSEEEHINHVIRSPFTCYDWEKSKDYSGLALKEIFPVGRIQLFDFFNSRRGVLDYLDNLNNGYISYQKYGLKTNHLVLKNKKFKINKRHKIEFSYHLCKFLIINLYKFEKQKNKTPNEDEIFLLIKKIFKNRYKYFYENYRLLEKLKKNNLNNSKFNLSSFVKKFIIIFINFLKKNEIEKIIFLRHAKTQMNNGTFLGIGRDPGIILKKNVILNLKYFKRKKIKLIFSSKLKRAEETTKLINKRNYILSDELIEKNYGKAEGLNYYQLKKLYPSLIKGWYKKKDLRFPLGENDEDVVRRINSFKKKLILKMKYKKKGETLIVTHNALLRCLVGDSFKIPKHMWYKIKIDHIEPINFILKGSEILPNTSRINLFSNMLN
jgi:broad specificity phosphatase PhoE